MQHTLLGLLTLVAALARRRLAPWRRPTSLRIRPTPQCPEQPWVGSARA